MQLILFDIDGTLLSCGRQTRGAIDAALRRVFGDVCRLDGYDFSGKTDPQIVFDLVRAAGIPPARIGAGMARAKRIYAEVLERELELDGMRLMPGVVELLEDLTARPEVLVGLLTGNWEAGARIKLSRFGLNRFFDFGAFGDGHRDRRELPPVALARAAVRAGGAIGPDQTLIIGDSTLDVDCARAHGIPSLAVATGWTPAATLRSAGADWVVADLPEARRIHPALAEAA